MAAGHVLPCGARKMQPTWALNSIYETDGFDAPNACEFKRVFQTAQETPKSHSQLSTTSYRKPSNHHGSAARLAIFNRACILQERDMQRMGAARGIVGFGLRAHSSLPENRKAPKTRCPGPRNSWRDCCQMHGDRGRQHHPQRDRPARTESGQGASSEVLRSLPAPGSIPRSSEEPKLSTCL